MYHTLSQVSDCRTITQDTHLLTVQAPEIARRAEPGQFVHIRVGMSYDPLLRRPFSIHRVDGDVIEILYQVVGRGTRLLSQVKPGETIDLLGPLGKGFDLQEAKSPLLVAGGLGVAPLLFLAQKLSRKKPAALIGGATREQILSEKRMRDVGVEVQIATEDGSAGEKGAVTDLLADRLSPHHSVFACGPTDMLKEVVRICRKRGGVACQVSLEERMGCGVGACLGCAVKSKNGGYKRVCSDGPVFHASEVIL